ncbi:MAG: anti-sigma factor family protein [Phycisphaerae bacterium]
MPSATPTYEQLLAFAAGELTGSDASAIEAYLAVTPAVAREVARMRTVIGTMRSDESVAPPREWITAAQSIFKPKPSVIESWLSQAATAIAALMFDSRQTPALAGFRGSATAIQLSYECDGMTVDLQLEPADQDDAGIVTSWNVIGQIAFDEMRDGGDVAVVIAQSRQPVAQARTDEHGVFRMTLASGTFDLILHVDSKVVAIPNVFVGA